MKRGNRRSGRQRPDKPFPFHFSSLREELSRFWMDPQHAAHAAHAYDPSVLDASTALAGSTADRSSRLSILRGLSPILPGTVSNEVFSHTDMLPTLAAAAGDPTIWC